MDPKGDFWGSSSNLEGSKFRYYHSSYLAGAPIAAAGTLYSVKGKLQRITDESGHYQPSPRALMQALYRLKELGVDLSETQVYFNSVGFKAKDLLGD